MVAIGDSNHAFFFDGISDSIVIPQGRFSTLGHRKPEGGHDARDILGSAPQGDSSTITADEKAEFVVEAWVVPDCGGTIIEKENQFKLSIGNVDTPGPLVFEVYLSDGQKTDRHILRTAAIEANGYNGTVYPPSTFGGIHDSYNRFNSSYDDATDMNRNHRPLIHVIGTFHGDKLELYVNETLMVRKTFGEGNNLRVVESNSHTYVGGKGGQFRGVLEALHVADKFDTGFLSRGVPLLTDNTLLLFRFEEPITPIDNTYTFSDTSSTVITISTTDAVALAKKLTGNNTVSGTVDFTVSPYSSGNYIVIQPGSGGSTNHQVPHVPFNLLINPNGINPNTKKPNQKPPERVRLESINTSNGQLTISSIHLDYDTASSGRRGLLHTSHTANVDNKFVVVGADLLVDSATGKPYQPPHYSTQVIDRTGQMVIDESDYDNHGFVFSSRMANTIDDTNNPFAVVWPTALDTRFSVGHSGRHIENHVDGHHYLRMLPPPNDEILNLRADGSADIVEIIYDESVKGADKQVSVNSKLDVYRETGDLIIKSVKNSSTVKTVYNSFQGVSITGTKRLLAIGGVDFDYTPFLLKGPSPKPNSIPEDNLRTHHLRPSKESRIALLHLPVLRTTYNMAPFVEIHYNAIDLTGASMDTSNTNAPLLMVEKTVPASTVDVGTNNFIYDLIAAAASGGLTLYAPGGVIEIDSLESTFSDILTPHNLVGDNSEGYDSDDALDESLTPVNHTPYAQTDAIANTTPQIITDSVSQMDSHESVFNKMKIDAGDSEQTLTSSTEYHQVGPGYTVPTPSNGEFDTGVTPSSTQVFEMFDIIDNVEVFENTADMGIIIQPSDRRRTNQLQNVHSAFNLKNLNANRVTLYYLMSRTKVRAINESEDGEGTFSKIVCYGVTDALSNATVNLRGKGSPDSHIVKEIEPNSPVVTVTLGGPGQGAMDTNPTFEKSVLAHAPYSTRRAYALRVIKYTATSGSEKLYVEPLNNNSADMKSWGTYGFPRYGRVHFPSGGSARYEEKQGNYFDFSYTATLGSGDFLAGDGSEFTTFTAFLKKEGLLNAAVTTGDATVNFTVMSESDFGDESLIENGSTVNDRMFQAMSDVTHDYQLSTQYASTRALVEIPFFANQMFSDERNGVLVGPDNSFKVHLDATMTAHTWNPNPVGRRPKDVAPADREADSSYSFAIEKEEYVTSTIVLNYIVPAGSTTGKLYVEDASIFPVPNTSDDEYKGVDAVRRYRRAYLADGSWVYYSAINTSDNYLTIPVGSYVSAKQFSLSVKPGIGVSPASSQPQEGLRKIASDEYTPSSDYEGRSEYHYDVANVKTQGGNVDYGLRQYVSAVELKAGPDSNPNAAAIEPKRASGVILSAVQVYSANIDIGLRTEKGWSITLSEEDMAKFPDLGIDAVHELGEADGDMLYEVQIGTPNGTQRGHYYGFISNASNVNGTTINVDPTTIFISTHESSTGADIVPAAGNLLTLTRRCRRIFTKDNQDIDMEQIIKYTMHKEFALSTSSLTNAPTLASSSNLNYLTVTATTGHLLGSNAFGFNIKTGDVAWEYYDGGSQPEYKFLGVVDYVKEYSSGSVKIYLDANTSALGGKLVVQSPDYEDPDAILNTAWVNPYASGGMRNGDTIWANMAYNNPHAVEGLFFKSRGVLNESQVWRGFNGGVGELDTVNPRDSIPLENFLIGKDCIETARNLVQHINKTIEENYLSLGLLATQAPTVAYVDPYLAKKGHARVLLYDVAHDREFIALQDIHMQVQTSAQTSHIGWNRYVVDGSDTTRSDIAKKIASINGGAPHAWATQIDVANGYPSQNRYIRSTQQSKFIESAYAHDTANYQDAHETKTTRNIDHEVLYGKSHGHFVHTGYSINGAGVGFAYGSGLTPRSQQSTVLPKIADESHAFSRNGGNVSQFVKSLIDYRKGKAGCTFRDPSTFFDTPDGTRVIPAFLCLKGIRSTALSLDSHEESRLQHLPQWKDMDFVRRLTVDVGEIGQKEGVVDVVSGAQEIVRVVNQYAALNGRLKDGSAHDPAVWWDDTKAFSVTDKGTHMGYLRAHLGREVQDLNGNKGYTIVIHSTIPGATGRNFCVWLDNSKGQTTYQPQFLIGHGGRWRNFWALPEESQGENMHPAPMPLNKHGRPFAPITTLQQYIQPSESGERVRSPNEFGTEEFGALQAMSNSMSGKSHNTTDLESLDIQGSSSTLVKGLRIGKKATARVNFGGLVASGVPGWSPNAGKWGYGNDGDASFNQRYGKSSQNTYSTYVSSNERSNVGTQPLYGLQLEDHLGTKHGIRYIYKRMGDNFANENTTLPNTIENEICVFFNDKDVSQGGFTIGKHMSGSGDATGRMEIVGSAAGSNRTDVNWRGNLWRGISAPNLLGECQLALSGSTLTVTLHTEPYASMTHDDKLGYLGFPKEDGMAQITAFYGSNTSNGETFYYERREGLVFYGVEGLTSVTAGGTGYLISPVLSWTSLVTDELLAAVTAAAINTQSVYREEGHIFDCRDMYATDGKTFGEWGITKDAIRIKAYNPENDSTPISSRFSASLFKDLGIQASHLEFGEIERANFASGVWDFDYDDANRPFTDANIDASKQIDCGYIPYTVLQITTIGLGSNANTMTPTLVDSNNNAVNVSNWRKHLQGEKFTKFPGDHILPMIDNPLVITDSSWAALNLNITSKPYTKGTAVLTMPSTTGLTVGDWVGTTDNILGKISTINTNTSITIDGGILNDIPSFASDSTVNKIAFRNPTSPSDDTGWKNVIKTDNEMWVLLPPNNTGVTRKALIVDTTPLSVTTSLPSPNPETNKATVTDTGEGSGLTLDITYIQGGGDVSILSLAVNQAGTGYKPGDTFHVTSGNLHATFTNLSGKIAGIATVGDKTRVYLDENTSVMVEAKADTNSKKRLSVDFTTANNWPEHEPLRDTIISKHASLTNSKEFDGLRSLGSVFSEPIVHFKGGKNSVDHSVPLFFGGGFSGAVIDVNDGTNNDYSSFYSHPYANGPTGVSGIQNANEILSSHAMVDCNAMFAFFPGTPLCNQHRGTIIPPFFNKDNMLTPDLDRGTTAYAAGVVKAKPVPLVLRFAHPTARYQDHRDDTDSKTTYIVFGPGQAFPFTQEVAYNTAANSTTHNVNEPFSGKIITSSNTWASIPRFSAAARMAFPNHITNADGHYLPDESAYYHARAGMHWKAIVNWETPAGYCNFLSYKQRPQHGRMYGQTINAETTFDSRIHPMRHTPLIGFGIAMGADTVFHMDGGFHAGGSWLDNQLTFNPKHPKKDTRITGGNSSTTWERDNQIHPTAFRVAGPLMGSIQDYIGTSTNFAIANTKMEYIVVDGTRCQNGEELATVLGAAINAFPGAGALKALGGTHMPSMGGAMRQDRYGWVNLGTVGTYNNTYPEHIESAANSSQAILEQVPASGWLRTNINTNNSSSHTPRYAAYHSRDIIPDSSNWKIRFYLAPNRKNGNTKFERTSDGADVSGSFSQTLFVWSKAGTIRFNNEDAATRDHMCQAHFSGIVDAIDRTRPIGTVGWHGERYSYLNSLKITKMTSGTGYAAGLGAYHPFLAFSPYGTAGTVMNSYGNMPVINPMFNSPESTPTIDGIASTNTMKTYIASPYTDYTMAAETRAYTFRDTEDATTYYSRDPVNYQYKDETIEELTTPQGVYTSAFLVVTHESESALVAKFDRDGITATGDWLQVKGVSSNPIQYAGTTLWDERFHGQDRFICTANAGPNVEALIVDDTSLPSGSQSNGNWADGLYTSTVTKHLHGAVTLDTELENAIPDRAKTGNLLNDLDYSIGSLNLETSTDVERNVAADNYTGTAYTAQTGFSNQFWMQDVNAYQMYSKSPAKNFTVENVVWKRMDGGSLSLPAINARGLGGIPWVTRVSSNTAYTTGEKIYGNVRFSFETTNSAMLPVLQAQELSHPQLASTNPYLVNNVLNIPNEETQFDSITVIDDTGQEHIIEGGSPFGTIIRGFRKPTNRGTKGLAPALANSDETPNLKIQLPNPNRIPGNIVVRGGFDPLQAYQGETMGSGGMMHPDLSETHLGHLFDNSVSSPRGHPTYENHNWEHIDPLTLETTKAGWDSASLQTSYEMHDRTLFFHITKMAHTHTHRYPTVYTHAAGLETNDLTASSWNSATQVLTANGAVDADVFSSGFGSKEVSDNRRFIRVYNPTTEEGVVASYTGINGLTFTGVVGDIDFTTFMAAQTITALKIVPSYYMPAGSARLFAANRLRDHAEVSGNSPDMAHTEYVESETIAYNRYNKPVMTPMPYPRMGHHFVNATMPMLPGHWAHPVYQSLYRKHRADYNMKIKTADSILANDKVKTIASRPAIKSDLDITEKINPLEAEINFSGISALPSGPSDIHGGAYALMFESSVRYDGYGVLATTGHGGVMNKLGGHSITLTAAANYTLGNHFPDPAEVGAYQIVIQPNLHSSQIQGYNLNGGTYALTSQQVNTVVGIKNDDTNVGGLILILARATQADVRGCEMFMNEVLLDINPDYGSQFTKIPPLLLHNQFGINLHETPSFTRRGFPYIPMYSKATPGYTLNIPWWSILFADIASDIPTNTHGRLGTTQYAPHNYYQFSKTTFGSIGNQLTMQGYPSIYPDMYSKLLQNTSIIPKCTVISFNAGSNYITIDDGSLFPVKPRFGEKLRFEAKDGNTYTATYTKRDGHDADAINLPNRLEVTNTGEGAVFFTNLHNGATIYLSSQYNLFSADNILKDTKRSVFANFIDDIVDGSKDTSSLNLPDAFICLWHPNLGKPYTYFSDDMSNRTWNGNAYNAAMYNALPEHFETIHYHSASYAMSLGPFSFKQKAPKENSVNKNGQLTLADGSNSPGSVTGSDFGFTIYNRFWPCGSRGGAQCSSLEEYVFASISWDKPGDYDSMKLNWYDIDGNSYPYSVSSGLSTNDRAVNERRAYGYRVGLRQALNKPRWGLVAGRAHLEGGSASGSAVLTTDYDAGPLVQSELYNNGWLYKGGGGDGNATAPKTYVGVMERLTNFTGMLGIDKPDDQVRYSQGRRMTRPFGAPVRTLRQRTPASVASSKASRDWWGDGEGKGITELSEAAQYYLVDWWNNERGEDIRRAPVRGFGMRPTWDCGDAYEYDRTNGRTPHQRIWNNGKPIFNTKFVFVSGGTVALSAGKSIPRFGGTLNEANNNDEGALIDVFAPTNALRVGDMGNGRGVRYPTHFNEDKLTALSAPVEKTGIVLSHNTAEPLFSNGLMRPRNEILQNDEVERGISARLGIAEDGLLQSEAIVSDRTEVFSGDSPHKDPISRTSPRIGIDGETEDESEDHHIIINTEAHSLHTDRNVGQKVVLHGALQTTQSLGDASFTASNFSRQSNGSPVSAALRFSHTNPFRPYGGSYILESKSYAGVFDDTGWGRNNLTGSQKTSNPYQKAVTYNLNTKRNNNTDKVVRFLLRPIRLLDKQHIELFRINNALHSSSPQYTLNYHYASSGGKYGIFNYEVTTGRNAVSNYISGSDPNGNGPYYPIFVFDEAGTLETPLSYGPNLPGSEVTGFDKTDLKSTVTRLLISDNTLQHHRSDAARRKQEEDTDDANLRMNYAVKARFSQSLHSKGDKGDVTFSTSDHSGDAS